MWKEIRKNLKKWIFAGTPLRIWSIFSWLFNRVNGKCQSSQVSPFSAKNLYFPTKFP